MSFFTYKGKQVYYEEHGEGELLFLLHGNTASGHMFDEVKALYEGYHIVIPDFLGHGRSDALKEFPIDFWYDEGLQILALLNKFSNQKAILIGSSGGAMAAINAALTDCSQIRCVIADSFVGEACKEAMYAGVQAERAEHLASEEGSLFYRYMQGEQYREIVEMDTAMLLAHARTIGNFYHKAICEIQVPMLILGSKEDNLISDIEGTYTRIANTSDLISCVLFENGEHPAMLSNAVESANAIHAFLKQVK